MAEKDLTNLGKALAVLGLEDKFLSNGELSNFPLVERGRIANGIISEKLKLGRWQSVVQMIYGGFGKADALYEGDRDELRDGIVRSATEQSTPTHFGRETLDALSKAEENDLLFRLATANPSLDYDRFDAITLKINPSYFKDPEKGDQRKQKLHKTAADKAIKEGKYFSAFNHFTRVDDYDGIGEVFEAILASADIRSSGELLEQIALRDPAQRDMRLKKIVLSSISDEEKGLNPLVALKLSKKHNVVLSPKEKVALQERVAESTSRYDVESKLSDDLEERLLWAKKHSEEEPRAAYGIFTQQGFDGASVITAIQAGLNTNYQNKERALETSEVSETHLKRAYKTAPFDVKVKIASYLKDSDELQKLSRQAQENGDLNSAYHLWVNGGGSLMGEYIDGIRTALINECIENNLGIPSFLERSDKRGIAEAYDTLMQTNKGKRTENIRHAYEIALDLDDEEMVQRAREEIVAISPEWAIRNFTSQTRGNDEKGLDYVLGVVAIQHGVERVELRRLFRKFQTT